MLSSLVKGTVRTWLSSLLLCGAVPMLAVSGRVYGSRGYRRGVGSDTFSFGEKHETLNASCAERHYVVIVG